MEDFFDLEGEITRTGINTRGSFSRPQISDSNTGSIGGGGESIVTNNTTAIISSHVSGQTCEAINPLEYGESGDSSTNGTNWNVATVVCCDGSSLLDEGQMYGSGSLDGTPRGFWPIVWDSLSLARKSNDIKGILSWPYRPVTRLARQKKYSLLIPTRLSLSIAGYSQSVGLVLIKQSMRDWLHSNKGFCLIIGGPGARPSNPELPLRYIRCFGTTPYHGNHSRDCVINSIGNVFYLLLGNDIAHGLVHSLTRFIASASRRTRPFNEARAEVSDLLRIGHIGPVFQEAGGHLGLKKCKVPSHGHLQDARERFNWLFEKTYYGRIFLVRLFEAGVVDHVLVIDSRRWPGLIYDSSDVYPIMLSSVALFHCAGPDARKVKIIELYEVFRHRRTGEKRKELREALLQMPRGTKKARVSE